MHSIGEILRATALAYQQTKNLPKEERKQAIRKILEAQGFLPPDSTNPDACSTSENSKENNAADYQSRALSLFAL